MRKTLSSTWGRGTLALMAVIAIGGPGFVLADPPCDNYLTPRSAKVIGPGAVATNTITPYKLKVFFTDGSNATCTNESPLTYSITGSTGTAGASFMSSNNLHSAGLGRVSILGIYNNTIGQVSATKVVNIHP